jgi:hypothetical protein
VVNEPPVGQLENTIAVIRKAGAVCDKVGRWDAVPLLVCDGADPDDSSEWTVAEQYSFRDGWWVTTWQASTVRSIDDGHPTPLRHPLAASN